MEELANLLKAVSEEMEKYENVKPEELGIKNVKISPVYAPSSYDAKCGDYVSVMLCSKELNPDEKSFLGVYIGEIGILHNSLSFRREKSTGNIDAGFYAGLNPAFFVPELNKVVFGCESYWSKIESPEHLRKITKDDINNVWYVQAMKYLDNNEEKID